MALSNPPLASTPMVEFDRDGMKTRLNEPPVSIGGFMH